MREKEIKDMSEIYMNEISRDWLDYAKAYGINDDILKLIIKEVSGEDYSRSTDYFDGFRDAMHLALYEIFIHEHVNYHTNAEDTLDFYARRADYKILKILDDMEQSVNRPTDYDEDFRLGDDE
jgi:hypothetical protein